MFSRLSEMYFNFLAKFGIGADIAIVILLFLCLYFVIKTAIKSAIKETQSHLATDIKLAVKAAIIEYHCQQPKEKSHNEGKVSTQEDLI